MELRAELVSSRNEVYFSDLHWGRRIMVCQSIIHFSGDIFLSESLFLFDSRLLRIDFDVAPKSR